MNPDSNLTGTEWSVLDCLWERSPQTTMELAAALHQRAGWAKSTTLTMLRRMTQKGLLDCQEAGGTKTYAPLIPREDAVTRETARFLDRVYRGSVSMMVSTLTQKQALTKAELDELYAILQRAEEAGK